MVQEAVVMNSENVILQILQKNVPEFFISSFYNPSFDSFSTFLFQDLIRLLEYLINNSPEDKVITKIVGVINDIALQNDEVLVNILSTEGFIGLYDIGLVNNQKYLHFIYPQLNKKAIEILNNSLKLWLGDRYETFTHP